MFDTQKFFKKLPVLISLMYMDGLLMDGLFNNNHHSRYLQIFKKHIGNNICLATGYERGTKVSQAIKHFWKMMIEYNLVECDSTDEELHTDIFNSIIEKKLDRFNAQYIYKDYVINAQQDQDYYMAIEKVFLNCPTRRKIWRTYRFDGFKYKKAYYNKSGRDVTRYIGWERKLKDNGYYGVVFYFKKDEENTIQV